MKIKVGINGFGRIGRYFTRLAINDPEIEIVAINDLASAGTMAHLLRYDSIHGRLKGTVEVNGDKMIVNSRSIRTTSFRSPEEIPWKAVGADVVIESSGLFITEESALGHLKGGAKKVIISAPSPSPGVKTIVMGVNDNILDGKEKVISNASCTTNSAAPLVAVMKQLGNIECCYITTTHSYTTDQRVHDSPHEDLRRARAAAESIIPTSTGAAKAITRIFPELEGRMGGMGIRVPVPNGSLTDMTFVMNKKLSVDEINAAFKKASVSSLKGILDYTEDPIVSIDIIGIPFSATYDSKLTSVVGKMVKVVSWYDNEAGYSNRLVDLLKLISKKNR
jgi:glyceraldehyde 3-phosphate dehydrogenase